MPLHKFMVDIFELVTAFRQRYGSTPRIFRAPGRVNLIGEHTDYNQGFVLPMAIDRGTAVAIAGRPDRKLQIRSLNVNDSCELDLNQLGQGRKGKWTDYIEGVCVALMEQGMTLTGANIILKSDVSIGGGLSSSAALEVSLGMALLSISGCPIDKRALAFAGQTAEHRHVGIHCGIMDQFSCVFAKRNHAILLDCRCLEARNVPLNFPEYQIVVCNSGVRHSLASSEYNQRRQDCELGVKLLGAVLPGIESLRDVTASDFKLHQALLPGDVVRRCRHVISENARTLEAAEALAAGDALQMGRLMTASHNSLREDYEVSCRELDLLVETAMAKPGVAGARMTGGGFGGCTVNLVESRWIHLFHEEVCRDYFKQTGIKPEIFASKPADGAEEMNISGI